ncbi:Peptidase A1 [Corchorus capsularis]|uniref:Peptidase A1 n=1 Tax=Corchorus capsularis TaxID=210143 RepID=A0A1R3JZT2_COCAP|nr:Peptidase A1 [Corchorus capsularis]
MASSSSICFLFSIAILFILGSNAATTTTKPSAFLLPIYKDKATLQYYTNIKMGNNPGMEMNVVIDLGGLFFWFSCDGTYASQSYHAVSCDDSAKCEAAKTMGCISCLGPVIRPGCTNNTCSLSPFNPFNKSLSGGDLSEDQLIVSSTDGLKTIVPSFPFACVSPFTGYLDGFAAGTKGMLGLSRGLIALPTQLSLKFKIPRKFALCLPSSTSNSGLGDIFIGGGPYLSKSLTTTPLVINPVSTAPAFFVGDASEEYFINVKSIKVDAKTVSLNNSLLKIDGNGFGGTKFSTIEPYTVLHTSIYKAVLQEFANKAASMKMTRVASVAPFGLCFSSKTIRTSGTGPAVPAIDLVLESSRAPWRIYGHNSMVQAHSIYKALVNEFVTKAKALKAKQVKSVAPFGACFSSKTITNSKTGPAVPVIDIVLHRSRVVWRIYGHNSMVKVKKNVKCLGFVDGGSKPTTSIVIGGHQLEDNLVVFDLASSKLGLSSSLLLKNTSCLHSRLF